MGKKGLSLLWILSIVFAIIAIIMVVIISLYFISVKGINKNPNNLSNENLINQNKNIETESPSPNVTNPKTSTNNKTNPKKTSGSSSSGSSGGGSSGEDTGGTTCTPSLTCSDYLGQCGTNLSDGCNNLLDCSNACGYGKTCNLTILQCYDLPYDYVLYDRVPIHVARGKNLYGYLLANSSYPEPGETVTVKSISPEGISFNLPYNFFWRLSNSTGSYLHFNITVSQNATLGEKIITVTGNSSITHLIHSYNISFIVEEMPPELPTPEFGIEQPIDPSAIAAWETIMTSNHYGGAYWGNASHMYSPDVTEETTWFYDGIRVFHNIADYTGNLSWYNQADNVRDLYVPYVAKIHNPAGRDVFTQGLVMDALRRDPTSQEYLEDLQTVHWLAAGDNGPQATWQEVDPRSMREVSYGLEASLDAIALNQTPFPRWPEFVDNLLGQFDEWCRVGDLRTETVDPTYPGYFVQPFMNGLASEALIKYYEYTVREHEKNSTFPIDTRIPPAVKTCADWLIYQWPDQATKTDIEVDSVFHSVSGVNKYAIRSISAPFSLLDNRKSIHITSGTGWNPGWYIILSAPDSNGWVPIDNFRSTVTPPGSLPPTNLNNTNKATGNVEVWNAWSPEGRSWLYKFHYLNSTVSINNIDWVSSQPGGSPGIEGSGFGPMLNSLIFPTYAWLYKTYGETNGSQYRIFGDYVFNSSFNQNPLYNPYNGKEFCQTYRRTFDYVQWRRNIKWQEDYTSPTILNISENSVTDTSNYVSWKTNEPTISVIEYGLDSSYGNNLTNNVFKYNHMQEIHGLNNGQTYRYRIKAIDSSGNYNYSVDMTLISRCNRDEDCNGLENSCSYGTCNSGKCEINYRPLTFMCRNSGECYNSTYCTGSSGTCPVDVAKLSGSICNGTKFCDGNGSCLQCLSDLNCNTGYLCRDNSCFNNLNMKLIVGYDFENNVNDVSGNNNNGIINGAIFINGKIGQGVSFNGINNSIIINNSVSLNSTKNITISFWAYLNSRNSEGSMILLAKRPDYYHGYVIQINLDYLTIDFGGSNYRWNTGYYFPTKNWTHIVYTYGGNSGKLYINGNLYSQTTSADPNIVPTSTNLFIGSNSFENDKYFNGTIDELKIYNYPFNESEVTKEYNRDVSGFGSLSQTNSQELGSINFIKGFINRLRQIFGLEAL